MQSRTIEARHIASLLAVQAPEALGFLRQRFPQLNPLLEADLEFDGGSSVERATPVEADQRDALRQMIKVAAATGEQTLGQIIPELIARGRRVRKMKLAGSITSALGSVAVVSSAATEHFEWAVASSLVTLTSSICTLLGEHLEKSIVGGKKSVGDLLSEAIETEAELRELRLRCLIEEHSNSDTLIDLVRLTNKIASKVNGLMIFSGVDVQPTDRQASARVGTPAF